MNMIIGLFDYYHGADRVVQAFEDFGIERSRLGVVTRYNDTIKEGATAAGVAAATGAVTGGLVGLLTDLKALLIPGIGPVIATGEVAHTLQNALGMTDAGAGVGVGAAIGSLLGGLMQLGCSREDADFYAEAVKRGGVLIFVDPDGRQEGQIRDILYDTGAVDIDTRRRTWQDEGWTSFEETEKSGEQHK